MKNIMEVMKIVINTTIYVVDVIKYVTNLTKYVTFMVEYLRNGWPNGYLSSVVRVEVPDGVAGGIGWRKAEDLGGYPVWATAGEVFLIKTGWLNMRGAYPLWFVSPFYLILVFSFQNIGRYYTSLHV